MKFQCDIFHINNKIIKKMQMNNKNGSHVGFVISFVLFITFIIFMYTILNSRIDFGQEKANSLNYVKAKIIDIVSENLTGVSIAIGQQNPQSCVQLRNFFLETGVSDRFVVKSDSGNVLQSGKSGNDLYVERSGNLFFRVYGSEEFNIGGGVLGNCQPLSEGSQGYTLGLSRDSKDIFESKIIKLLNNYTADYEALKKDMKISSGDEFGFGFIYSNGTEIKTTTSNVTINVYADRVPVQYVKTDATIESGFIDIIVW